MSISSLNSSQNGLATRPAAEFTSRRSRIWWNWQTRYFEVVVPKGVQVQVLLSAPPSLHELRPGYRRMADPLSIAIVSDIHHAGPAEQLRRGHEQRAVANPFLRFLTAFFRHLIWLRDPFAHNHLLDRFIAAASTADRVVANGDYSCDTAFVGVSDEPAFASASLALGALRRAFGNRFAATIGDHELGKMSLFGGRGGLRWESWSRTRTGLGLEPLWQVTLGRYQLLGVTSSVLALPVYSPETLPDERSAWEELRRIHLDEIRRVLDRLSSRDRLILFCHDPTALPFLWREGNLRQHQSRLELTVIGHLHTQLIYQPSRWLAGMPRIGFLGNAVRRMSEALRSAREWKPFNVKLCPSLAGSELLRDGGFCWLTIDVDARQPLRWRFEPIPREPPTRP